MDNCITDLKMGKTYYDKQTIREAIMSMVQTGGSVPSVANQFGLPVSTLKYWKQKYTQFGGGVFENNMSNAKEDTKENAIADAKLSGKSKKFNIVGRTCERFKNQDVEDLLRKTLELQN